VTHKASYLRGKGLVARVDASGSRAYYSHNGHGDVTQLTDQAGNVLNSYTYDMWGNPLTASETVPNLFRYSGEYWDETTGLQYLRARWYDPSVGRFMNEDTYEGDIKNPLTLNLYTYVHNNPLIHTDPSGNIPTPMEAAYMAQHIYSASTKDYYVGVTGGWKLQNIINNSEGLKIGVYYRTDGKGVIEYAFVNKGSSTGGDWINNAQQPFGYSTDMIDSIAEAVAFVKKYGKNEITMVGHSKGGAEAAANAVATGRDAILFNPATVNLSEYNLDSSTYSGKMTAYIVKGEVLNQVFGPTSKPIGSVVYLPTQYRVNYRWNVVKNVRNSLKNHSMDAVKNALKEAGYK
ncbi:RHS repeat-associated core domain-containing protein, partial [Paenibacillus sp. GCM10012307]